ncbi:MAG: transposase, partial [Prevotella denticola]
EFVNKSSSWLRRFQPHPTFQAGFHSFNVIAATFYEHYDDILNFYINRSTNAAAESFNAKIKLFRANLRGVVDKSFFLFRLAKLYAYPH